MILTLCIGQKETNCELCDESSVNRSTDIDTDPYVLDKKKGIVNFATSPLCIAALALILTLCIGQKERNCELCDNESSVNRSTDIDTDPYVLDKKKGIVNFATSPLFIAALALILTLCI